MRASEVGEYVFCHRAWWLRTVEGREPNNRDRLAAGARSHTRYGMRIAASRLLLGAGVVALAIALLALLLGS